jgi:membrane protease YdiL (CAAX protease family)
MRFGLIHNRSPETLMRSTGDPVDSGESTQNSREPSGIPTPDPSYDPHRQQPPGVRNIPWRMTDIVGGVGLSIAAAAAVLVSGFTADGIIGQEPGSAIATATAVMLAAIALSLLVAWSTRLPLGTTFVLVGFTASANALVYTLAHDGRFLGLSTALIEQAFTSSVPFGVTWLFVGRKYGRSIRDLGLTNPEKPSAYIIGVASWFVAVQAVNLWQLLVRNIDFATTPDNTTPVLEIAGGSFVIAWVLSGLLVPVVEEVFFRGFLLRGILSKTGRWPAILLSSGIFAVFHIEPGLYVPTFLLGIAFAWVSLKTRSLWPTIVTHSLQNTLSLLLAAELFAGQ